MKNFNKRYVVFPLFLLIVIDAMGAGLILTILPGLFLSKKFGFLSATSPEIVHYFMFGLSLSLFPLFMIFSAPWLGKLSDLFGRRKLLMICSSLNMICYLILACGVIYQNLALFLLGRCLAGCVAGNQPIAQAALVDASKNNYMTKFKNLSLVSIAGSVGVIIGPILGGLTSVHALLEKYGYSTPFLICAFMSLINVMLLALFFYEEKKSDKENNQRIFLNPIKFLLWAINHEKTRYLALILFLGQLGWGLFFQSLILRMNLEYHFEPVQLGYFLAYIGASVSIGGIFIGRFLIKKLPINKLATLSLAILSICAFLSGLIAKESMQWIFVFFGSVCAVIFNSSLLHLFTDAVEKKLTGLILGITMAVICFAGIISGFLSGLTNYVNYSFGPFLSAALAFTGFIFILLISRSMSFYALQSVSQINAE